MTTRRLASDNFPPTPTILHVRQQSPVPANLGYNLSFFSNPTEPLDVNGAGLYDDWWHIEPGTDAISVGIVDTKVWWPRFEVPYKAMVMVPFRVQVSTHLNEIQFIEWPCGEVGLSRAIHSIMKMQLQEPR